MPLKQGIVNDFGQSVESGTVGAADLPSEVGPVKQAQCLFGLEGCACFFSGRGVTVWLVGGNVFEKSLVWLL